MPKTTGYNYRSSGDFSVDRDATRPTMAGLSRNSRIACSLNPLGVGQLSDLSATGHTIGIAVTCDGNTAEFAMRLDPTAPPLHIVVLPLRSQTSRFARSGPSESALLQNRTQGRPRVRLYAPMQKAALGVDFRSTRASRATACWRNRTCDLRFLNFD